MFHRGRRRWILMEADKLCHILFRALADARSHRGHAYMTHIPPGSSATHSKSTRHYLRRTSFTAGTN